MERFAALRATATVALGLVAAFALPVVALAANVSGTLTRSDGRPQADRQIHFDDRVTRDLFLVQTGTDGSFSVDLPPGTYDLRAERGAVVASGIDVDQSDVALGRIGEPGGLSRLWPFGRQGVARGIVTTPAPSTANIATIEEAAGDSGTSPAPAEPPASSKQSSTPVGK